MSYQEKDFCEKLEEVKRRLYDLRAVIDSGSNIRIDSKFHDIPKNSHHSHYQMKCSLHKKSHKSHCHHAHHSHCHHISNQHEHKYEDLTPKKKIYTDNVGRRLYARAIPIERDYMLSRSQMARLMKESKNHKKEKNSIRKTSKRPKTPILFPFDEFKIKQSDVSQEYDYDYYEDYSENNENNKQSKGNSNKKQISYLKTYQLKEKNKKSSDEPKIFQEKGTIIYYDDSCNDNKGHKVIIQKKSSSNHKKIKKENQNGNIHVDENSNGNAQESHFKKESKHKKISSKQSQTNKRKTSHTNNDDEKPVIKEKTITIKRHIEYISEETNNKKKQNKIKTD